MGKEDVRRLSYRDRVAHVCKRDNQICKQTEDPRPCRSFFSLEVLKLQDCKTKESKTMKYSY